MRLRGERTHPRPRFAGGSLSRASVNSFATSSTGYTTARRAEEIVKSPCLSESKYNRHGRLAFPARRVCRELKERQGDVPRGSLCSSESVLKHAHNYETRAANGKKIQIEVDFSLLTLSRASRV